MKEKNYNEVGKDTVGVINYITDSKLPFNELEDKFDMCKGLDELKAEGKVEGALEKEQNNIKTMHKNGASIETISKLLGLDINYVKEVLAK